MSESVNNFDVGNYNVEHSFQCSFNRMAMDDVSVQLWHVDVPMEVLPVLEKYGHYVINCFWPMSDNGLWLRLMPEPAMRISKLYEDGCIVDYEKVVSWLLKDNVFVGHKGECSGRQMRERKKEGLSGVKCSDGVYLYVPKGNLLFFPATLIHSGSICIAADGGHRGKFTLWFENTSARKSINELLVERAYANCNDYITRSAEATRIVVQECMHRKKVLERSGKSVDENVNDQWITEGLKRFVGCFLVG